MTKIKPMITSEKLYSETPLSARTVASIKKQRLAITNILSGKDRRRLVILGPCSLDETGATLEFWRQLQPTAEKVANSVMTVLRAPVAKPRTIGGWRGLEQDSVTLARTQLAQLAEAGAPLAIELLEPYHTVFYGDILSLGWIGARTVASQNLRLEASRNSELPVLFKNATDGSIKLAAEGRAAAAIQHQNVPFMHDSGRLYIEPLSKGNKTTLIILRGGERDNKTVSNITAKAVRQAASAVRDLNLNNPGVILDVSHANGAAETNGKKSALGQKLAFQKFLKLAKNDKNSLVRGVMVEALLREGAGSEYGMSRTDPTVDIETAKSMLIELSIA